MIIFIFSNNYIRIIATICIYFTSISEEKSFTNVEIILEEPHAPQIKRDDEVQQDVGGAYAGPFNEGEELKLLCEVHGGRWNILVINHWNNV